MSYDERLDEIERRLLACRWPWGVYHSQPEGPFQLNAENRKEGTLAFVAAFKQREDAEFVKHAPEDVRFLLDLARRARREA